MAKSWVQQLPLLPLGPEAAVELLRDLLGNDASLAGLPARILERSAGNPFFVEEIVQELAERGVLQGAKGAYRLTTGLADLRIPASVQALLAARIDRLAEREKRVLQAASAIGLELPRALLASAAPLAAADLAAALSALVDAELPPSSRAAWPTRRASAPR